MNNSRKKSLMIKLNKDKLKIFANFSFANILQKEKNLELIFLKKDQ